MKLDCFKAYDIRGRLTDQLNEDVSYRIGRAFAQVLNARRVAIGGDVRLSSGLLKAALARGLMDAGSDVIDLGMTGTEEVYFASFHLDVDGGIEVTASHNPMDYNGMKLVARGAVPISGDSGLDEIRMLAESGRFIAASHPGNIQPYDILPEFVQHLMRYIDPSVLRPMRLVVNAGNGAAGPVVDALEAEFSRLKMPIELIKIHNEPDGSFPNGIPNPLLPENRGATADAVREHGADMGIAWDGDFDRCFLFDETGSFVEGYYIVGLLAEAFLSKNPGAKVIHDPRLIWNTQDIVQQSGGVAIQSKTGHAFIKERMRQENAVYGGEMSAHHYFRDFAYCDSGMIPWLLICELVSRRRLPLSKLVAERIEAYPCSGEINYRVPEVQDVITAVLAHYQPDDPAIDRTDGLSLAFRDFRLNLRSSNTEPLLRLNVESRADPELVRSCVRVVAGIVSRAGGYPADY